jgi:MFS family permease
LEGWLELESRRPPGLRDCKAHFPILGSSLGPKITATDTNQITGEKFNEEFPDTKGSDEYHSTIQGTVTSVYELGCFAGAMAALAYGERFGRRKSILFGAAVMILGTIIQITAFKGSWELGQFIIGRVITVSFRLVTI